MMYFKTLPKINMTDYKGSIVLMTNLLSRVELIQSLLDDPLLFYTYDIQEGDTPEIIADKYYGDSYRYWLVLFSNQLFDPQWDWPLTTRQFGDYLFSKYKESESDVYAAVIAATQLTIKEYRKVITTVDSVTLEQTIKTIVIDINTYTTGINSTTTQSFPDGSTVTQTIEYQSISIYDYELERNEAKRNINLINSKYAAQVEGQLQTLMGT
jgi:hypothetical protein